MAPPTILYNNTAAKYTKYEQTDTGMINETETALAKAMLSQDIQTFNTSAPSGNMNTSFSLITPASGSSQQLTHLLINQQQHDLGSVFAIAAQHDYDNLKGVVDNSAHLSFSTTSGSIGSNLGTNASGSVYITNDSASYYDSQLVIQTDNTEHIFVDNEDSIDNKYTVTFDSSSSNFNAEKAVNSRYSNYLNGSLATANPDLNKTDPLSIYEHTVFNSTDSIYTEKIVSRDPTNNMLSIGNDITNAASSLTNSSGQYYFGNNVGFGSGFIGIADDKHSAPNDEVFFGAVKLTQQPNSIVVSGSASGSSTTTLAMVPSDPGSNLPTSLTVTEFNDLFSVNELPYVGSEYRLTIREKDYNTVGDGVQGGYYTNGTIVGSGPFRGFTTDDTDVKRNTTYMRKCAEEGQNFNNSVQTVEIMNGDLIANRTFSGSNADLLINRVDVITNDVNGNPVPHDTDENLNASQYQNDYWVRSYFTEPSTSVSAAYHRADSDLGNTSSYTDFRVVYDASEGVLSSSILPNDRRSRYYENFDITTIFPSTAAAGAVFSGSNYIGIDNGFAAVFQDGNSGTNTNSDYTFTSSANAANLLASNEISIIHLINTQYLSNEDSLYVDGATGPLPYTSATVIGTNINYNAIENVSQSNTTDLRIKLSNKTGLSSAFTNNWSSSLSSGSVLKTDLGIAGIFGKSINNIMTNVSSSTGNTGIIPINFTLATNSTSDNQDSLNISITYSWSYSGLSGSGTILESDISLTGTNPAPSTDVLTLSSDYTFADGLTPAVQNLLGNYNLVRNVESRTTTPSFIFNIGAYKNIKITGKELVIRTVYHTLVHKTNGTVLPDSYIKYINLTSSYLSTLNTLGYGQSKASRQIIGTGRTSRLNLAISNLYCFTAVVQKRDGSSVSGWSDVSPSYDFDGAHGSFTTFTLNNNAGSIDASIDITTSSNNNVVLDQPLYYIELSTGTGLTSYSVAAKKWDINTLADAENITAWANSNDVSSILMPNGGTSVSLTATVTSSPVPGQPSTQPDVTITVTDSNGVVWANFVTNGVKATSSFNVLFSRRPVFHIIESYKNVTITVPDANGASWTEDLTVTSVDTYKMADTLTKLQVIDGIELTFIFYTAILDNANYTLLGDYLEASLYNGYAGTYDSVTEVTFDNGLVIGDSFARNIDINFYRGNSVRTAVSPATYEEFRWTRTPTQINMKIVNTDASSVVTTYNDTADNLYNGSTHIVDDLSGTIGDLNLKFNGNLSRFRNVNTSYTSQDVVMSQPITILFDAYKWTISNPFNTTNLGDVNAVTSAEGVVFTNYYSIRNYTGSNAMNIVASRVWIRNTIEEIFDFYYTTPPMQIDYLAEQYVGDPASFDWSAATRIDTITYADLNEGRHILHPDGVTESHLFAKFAPIIVQDFIGYFLLPRPQHVIEAIATDNIISMPYNFNTATRTTRYFDINLEINSHNPFASGFGTSNGLVLGTRVINDMTVEFNNNEKYINRVYNSAMNKRNIYIPSNKVNVKLYKGYSAHSTLDNGLLINTVYDGYIHKLKNYDVDNYDGVVDSITDPDTSIAIDTNIYNKFDNTFVDGKFNSRSDMSYDLSFTQDYTIISPGLSTEDFYGQFGNNVINIETEGFLPFMNLDSVSIENRHLDLITGDSIKLVLYGHTFTTNNNGDLVAEFVRYTTGTGYDFSTNAAQFFIQNLGFNASTRETATVILKTKSNVLTSTPFNFINVCATKASDATFNSLTWVVDNDWSTKTVQEKQLDFSMSCLSTIGQEKITHILGVSNRSPFRMIVCNYPNRIDLRSGDGSPLYVVNAFGKLMNISTFTQFVKLMPETTYTSSDDIDEYMAFNNLNNNTI